MVNQKQAALLITGAGGLLGQALCRQAVSRWPVVGVFHSRSPKIPHIKKVHADLGQQGVLESLVKGVRPAAIVHAAAVADVARCQKEPALTETINAQVPVLLAELCAKDRIPFVFTSTDLVFDGKQAPYDENARPKPLSIYARQKARAEERVLQTWNKALVCRLPLMIGLAPRFSSHFCSHMLYAIHEKQPLALFHDEYRTPADTESVAGGILQLLGRIHGLIHLGGRARISRHELGLMMASAMGVVPTMIKAVSLNQHPPETPRVPDVSLDSRKAYAAGYAPLPLEEGVKKVVDRFHCIVRDPHSCDT